MQLALNVVKLIRTMLGGTLWLVLRYPDVVVVSWILEAHALYAYLAARLISLGIPVALAILGRQVTPPLVALAQGHARPAFQAAAARVNLSYLMVSGGMALLLLSIAPYLAGISGITDSHFREILIWLVVGQSAPGLFGATGLLMHALDRGIFYDLLLTVTAVLFLVGVISTSTGDEVSLAQILAASQLTQGAVCAILLTQSGVWPGLTALFHKEIKLF